MFFEEDNTYHDIRDKSVHQWLEEMKEHEDVGVRCGVKVTEEYIQYLKDQIKELKDTNELKNRYLKKMKAEKMEQMEKDQQ
jgi:hypothetical protein